MTTKTGLELLREPFAKHLISKLPKPTKAQTEALRANFKLGQRCQLCGGWHQADVVHLDYVGHAALTDRLLDADPAWSWEPLAMSPDGLPVIDSLGGMWIKLTVCGVTRLGYGDAGEKTGPNAIKEVIGDALRNAAMRFGAALELWHKGDLHADEGKGADDDQYGQQGALTMFAPQAQAAIRRAAAAAIAAFDAGNEWGAFEEVMSCVDSLGKDDSDKANQVKLAFNAIFKPHSALRASLKRLSQQEHAKEHA